MSTGSLSVIGIAADGWPSVPVRGRRIIEDADVVVGGTRHLDLVPPVDGQIRRNWPAPLREALPALLEGYADRRVVALASGDPFVSGIGSTLTELGVEFDAIPAVSSVALARARMQWPAETVEVVSVVGRRLERVLAVLAPGARIIVLSGDETTPAQLADLLARHGHGAATMTVLGDLGTEQEIRHAATAGSWPAQQAVPRLNLVALEVPERPQQFDPAPGGFGSWVAGLPDTAFEHDGQLTKRDLRAAALARLAPAPGELLWDVGAGAGSVGIEWMRAHARCRTIAIEGRPDRADRITRNAEHLGVPNLEVVTGRAPEALAGLATPAAIFIGGGATAAELIDICQQAVAPGGRIVVHGVTLETEILLAGRYRDHGGELTRIAVEIAAPIGSFTGWTPARTVTQWFWTRPQEETP